MQSSSDILFTRKAAGFQTMRSSPSALTFPRIGNCTCSHAVRHKNRALDVITARPLSTQHNAQRTVLNHVDTNVRGVCEGKFCCGVAFLIAECQRNCQNYKTGNFVTLLEIANRRFLADLFDRLTETYLRAGTSPTSNTSPQSDSGIRGGYIDSDVRDWEALEKVF